MCRCLVGALLCLLGSVATAGWFADDQAIMGTRIHVELWSEDPAQAKAALEAVFDEMRRIDRLMSPFHEDTELARINREAADHPVACSPELLNLIREALQYSKLTGGAFDITFASAGHLYDYRRGIAPDPQALAEALPAIDWHHVGVNELAGTVAFDDSRVRIDLGGIAKGYAVDRSLELLKARGIRRALVTAGGDTGILGDRGGRPWVVGIRAPRDPDGLVARVPLENAAVSTSGDYERYFEADGRRYHHILNPRTGTSVGAVQSVTVIGPDATTTDALSTSIFVLGVDKGLALADRLDGIEAVIVDRDGHMHYSAGLMEARPRPGS